MVEAAEKIEPIKYATDVEICIFYLEHLDKPCNIIVNGKKIYNRLFYETLATEALKTMTDPRLKRLLAERIKGDL